MQWNVLAAVAALALTPLTSRAQQPTGDTGGLQKAVQNPVAGLISVPLQNNTNFGVGPFGRNQNVLNIQPVIPINVSQSWNMIIRCDVATARLREGQAVQAGRAADEDSHRCRVGR